MWYVWRVTQLVVGTNVTENIYINNVGDGIVLVVLLIIILLIILLILIILVLILVILLVLVLVATPTLPLTFTMRRTYRMIRMIWNGTRN